MRGRNVIKPFTIGGFIFGELYLIYAAFAPYYSNGEAVSLIVKITRVLTCSLFFGPFGAAAGMGVGILVGACLRKKE